jgi:hypothetical protein
MMLGAKDQLTRAYNVHELSSVDAHDALEATEIGEWTLKAVCN